MTSQPQENWSQGTWLDAAYQGSRIGTANELEYGTPIRPGHPHQGPEMNFYPLGRFAANALNKEIWAENLQRRWLDKIPYVDATDLIGHPNAGWARQPEPPEPDDQEEASDDVTV